MARRDEPPLHPDDVEAVVASVCFPQRADERCPGRVGLEVERFPIRRDPAGGRGRGRLTLEHSTEVLGGLVDIALGPLGEFGGLPGYQVAGGGRLTFEPGGQLEHVTAAHDTAAAALAEVEALAAPLASAFDDGGAVLASAGVDLWNDVDSVPLQLAAYRYPAMDAYLSQRTAEGRLMMRHTCALQVNVDLGPPADHRDRWLLANLLAPLLTATFATSPTSGAGAGTAPPTNPSVSARAVAWQVIDPTRTGFPRRLVDGSSDDPVVHMADAALDADVLIVRTADATAVPGAPGWTFADWLASGHPDFGPPTADDLAYHLSTIFLEVRPRGVLEFRSIDAVPHRWRAVPVVLLAGALEDAHARSRLLDLLHPHRASLPNLWRRAARAGAADPAFCALAVEAWSYSLEGASRLPPGYLPPDALARVEAFLERFTLRGRCPADELAERMRDAPSAGLAWAAEPVPEPARGLPWSE